MAPFRIVKKLFLKKKKGELFFQELFKIPRYTSAKIILFGREFEVIDNASFTFMYKEIFENKIYEFSNNNNQPYIIDGGANIGLSALFFKQRYPGAKVIAFEPEPSAYRALLNNIKAFDLSDVELVQKALWDCEGEISFHVEGADGSHITESLKQGKTIWVSTTSLRPWLNQKVDFLKLDIEGAETTVLEDIKDYLHQIDRIFVEYHSFLGRPQTLKKIIGILTDAGFRLHINSPGLHSPQPFINLKTYNDMDMQLNIYAFRV
jgi:FkbM family methyltransferase